MCNYCNKPDKIREYPDGAKECMECGNTLKNEIILNTGDRAGAIWRVRERGGRGQKWERIVVIAGYGTYLGAPRIYPKQHPSQGIPPLYLGELDSTIRLDSGELLDTDTCMTWGAMSTIKEMITWYTERGYTIMTKKYYETMVKE